MRVGGGVTAGVARSRGGAVAQPVEACRLARGEQPMEANGGGAAYVHGAVRSGRRRRRDRYGGEQSTVAGGCSVDSMRGVTYGGEWGSMASVLEQPTAAGVAGTTSTPRAIHDS